MAELRPGAQTLPIWKDPNATPFIKIKNVTKKFGDFVAVDDVSLDIYRGELFCLLGGSGSGKSTLLRMLAGFEKPGSGGFPALPAAHQHDVPVLCALSSYDGGEEHRIWITPRRRTGQRD